MSWGDLPWGSTAWGGGPGPIALLAAIIVRENAVRLEFSQKVYLTHLLDPQDTTPDKFTATPVDGTVGYDGSAARPVTIVRVEYAGTDDGVPNEAAGYFLLLTTDRPFTPYPAQYAFRIQDVFAKDLMTSVIDQTIYADSTFRVLQRPQNNAPATSRDFANPQTLLAAQSSNQNPGLSKLGTFQTDATGDYAFDDIQTGRRKRIVRRIVSRHGAFLHLPNYGADAPGYGKKLASLANISALLTDVETQIGLEPDIRKVKATLTRDRTRPGLFRIDVFVQPKVGKAVLFQVPVASE